MYRQRKNVSASLDEILVHHRTSFLFWQLASVAGNNHDIIVKAFHILELSSRKVMFLKISLYF